MSWPAGRKLGSSAAGFDRTTGNDQGIDACCAGTIYHILAIVIKAVMGEVDAYVYEVHGCENLKLCLKCIGVTALSVEILIAVREWLVALPAECSRAGEQEYHAHKTQRGQLRHDLGQRGTVEHNGPCRIQDMGERKNPGQHLDRRM